MMEGFKVTFLIFECLTTTAKLFSSKCQADFAVIFLGSKPQTSYPYYTVLPYCIILLIIQNNLLGNNITLLHNNITLNAI